MGEANKIKLVQVIGDSALGGGPVHVLGILKNIDKDKFDVSLICPEGFLAEEAKKISGIKVYYANMVSKFDFFSFFEVRSILMKIRASFDPFGPMIIHSHGARGGLMARTLKLENVKYVYTEHSLTENYHLKNGINEWFQKYLSGKLNGKTDLVIAVSSAVKKYIVDQKIAPKKRTVVIPNGIDLQGANGDGNGTRKIKEGNRHPIIGTLGNLNVQKGQKYLIQSMTAIKKEFPLATLEIVGEGPERQNLEKEIGRLSLGNSVSLLGSKRYYQDILRHWDVFVLPSISETFGIIILEAMAMGIPVVASKTGGIVDILTNKKNGLLVTPKDRKAIAGSILDILHHPVLAAKLKREGLIRVKDFDWKKIIKVLESEYYKLLS